MSDVVLVCMPFGSLFSPSLGLSLLKAGLTEHQISSRVHYFSITFAERVGQAFYWKIACDGGPAVEHLAGDWIFSAALFGLPPDSGEAYLDDILLNRAAGTPLRCSPALIRRLRHAREQVPAFLDDCVRAVLADQPRIVGFTSVFQQHVASLALAHAIKRERPETFVVFGGANCEGVMGAETLRQFDFVDAVVSGEGEVILPELARRILRTQPIADLAGVRVREALEREFESGRFHNAPVLRDLDGLPYADYEDYFRQFAQSRFGRKWQPSVTFETSRGCWWGERMHCTFCGLNGASMAYRRKSPRRALEELLAVTDRYPDCDVEVVDNILDMEYFKSVLPALATRSRAVNLFYETKSNLRKQHVRILRDAGVRRIQPGIESFSDAVLKLMRKGVTGLQNIQLLKWCKELGVTAEWNFLWGFPGEPDDEYARMARMVPLLTHLPPPSAATAIRLDRFSPNFFAADTLGLADVRPMPSYRYVYPLPPESVSNLAYYFTFRYQQPQDVDGHVHRLVREIDIWDKTAERSDLFGVDVDGRLVIWDLRPWSVEPLTVLDGVDRVLYLACDGISSSDQLVKSLESTADAATLARVGERLASFVAKGLMLNEGSRYLALAIAPGEYAPRPAVVEAVRHLARLLGRRRAGEWVIPLETTGRAAWRLALFRRIAHRRTSRSAIAGGKPSSPLQFSLTDRGDLTVR